VTIKAALDVHDFRDLVRGKKRVLIVLEDGKPRADRLELILCDIGFEAMQQALDDARQAAARRRRR
jgi:hypothetical protein